SLSDWIHLVIRIAQRVPLLPFVWPFEPLAPGLPFLGASSILADATICLGISASGKLAGSVPGAQRRNTILKPVVTEPSICTVLGAWPKPRSALWTPGLAAVRVFLWSEAV